MLYPEFQQLIDTMNQANYAYKSETNIIKKNIRKRDGGNLTLSDHVRSMVYAELSNNRKWEPIAQNIDRIDHIFFEFDIEMLKKASAENLIAQITAPDLHCGNRQIKRQMETLKDNISILEKIDVEQNGIDRYFLSVQPKELVAMLSQSESPYKLKCMGIALVCEYIKGVGIEIVKPDVHVRRLLGRLGYSQKNLPSEYETIDICKKIGEAYGLPQAMVDTVLWQYCADKKFNVCSKLKKCRLCGVNTCPSREEAYVSNK